VIFQKPPSQGKERWEPRQKNIKRKKREPSPRSIKMSYGAKSKREINRKKNWQTHGLKKASGHREKEKALSTKSSKAATLQAEAKREGYK